MGLKLFGGGGGGAPAPAAAPAAGAADPRAAAAADPAPPLPHHHLSALPEDQEGPVDYAPPPLGIHVDNLGAQGPASTKSFDAAESGREPSSTRPSFVWDGVAPSAALQGPPSWLGGSAQLDDGGVVKRVPSAACARRMSRRSSALSADFVRRLSSANFGKLGSDHDGHSGWPVAACHLVTAMIGAGILGLPNSFAWLGWIGGPLCLVFFFVVTVYCLLHLIECYHVGNIRHHAYADCVYHLCGKKHALVLACAQRINMSLTVAAYILAGAHSMTFIARSAYELQGKAPTAFASSLRTHTIIFAAVQILMSQLPNLESAWWSSAIGAGEFSHCFQRGASARGGGGRGRKRREGREIAPSVGLTPLPRQTQSPFQKNKQQR